MKRKTVNFIDIALFCSWLCAVIYCLSQVNSLLANSKIIIKAKTLYVVNTGYLLFNLLLFFSLLTYLCCWRKKLWTFSTILLKQVKYYYKGLKNILLFFLLILPFCFTYLLRIETIFLTILRDKIFTTKNNLIIANSVILIITMIIYTLVLIFNFLVNSFLKLEKLFISYLQLLLQQLLKPLLALLQSTFFFHYRWTIRVLRYIIINAVVNIFLVFDLQQIAILKKSYFFHNFKKGTTPGLIFNI